MDFKIIRAKQKHRSALNHLIVDAKIGSPISRRKFKNFFVAIADGKVVGGAGIERYKNAAIFIHCVVQRECRHLGIGSALIQRRMEMARKWNVEMVGMVTMYYLFRFYKKRGFRTCRRKVLPEMLKDYWMFTVQRYKKCAVMFQTV